MSTLNDKAALLLDMTTEQILCLFGDPYGMYQILSDRQCGATPVTLLARASFTVVFAHSRSDEFLASVSYTVVVAEWVAQLLA